jgi:hypothetical protein
MFTRTVIAAVIAGGLSAAIPPAIAQGSGQIHGAADRAALFSGKPRALSEKPTL